MGRPERELRCRKHPKHMQSKGVCPSCLREKLSGLSGATSSSSSTSATTANIDYSSSSFSYSSEDDDDYDEEEEEEDEDEDLDDEEDDESDLSSSTVSTPDHQYNRRGNSGQRPHLIAKSRSFAFVSRDRNEGKIKEEMTKVKKEKENFWSKLMMGVSSRKRKESGGGAVGLFHSRTVNERSSSRWVSVS